MNIAVIIATLNEEATIGPVIRAFHERGRPALVVVADCGSEDGTVSVAARAGACVVRGPGLVSRASAFDAGVDRARGERTDLDTLLLFHADSVPPAGWDASIERALAHPRVVGGGFDFQWDLAGLPILTAGLLLVVTLYNRVRFRLTKCFFGDQGIFVRPEAYDAIGGMPRVTLLEDVVMCRRLKSVGRLRLAAGRTVTSPRRFVRHGVVRQSVIDLMLLAAERAGLDPARLHAWYNRERS